MRDVDDYCLNSDYTSNRWNDLSKWKCCLREWARHEDANIEEHEYGKKYKYFRRSNLPLQYDNHLTI